MLELMGILAVLIYLTLVLPNRPKKKLKSKADEKNNPQMKKLWSIARESMKNQKTARAEKALLAILNFDERNAAAYNRLGILYTKEKKYEEATECFEIAQSLDKNPALIHNAGLIYLETEQYEKAAMAFRQALELEGDMPARFIALAKAEEKLGRISEALEALESAFELNHDVATLRQILALHEITNNSEAIAATTERIERQVEINTSLKKDITKEKLKLKKLMSQQRTTERTSLNRAETSSKRPVAIGPKIRKLSMSKSTRLNGAMNLKARRQPTRSGIKGRTQV